MEMTLELALAKIQMLEENNQRLTEMVNFLVNKPGPAAIQFQRMVQQAEQQNNKGKGVTELPKTAATSK